MAKRTVAAKTKKVTAQRQEITPEEEVLTLSVPVEKLDLYEGILGSDIVGENGAILFPAGIDLSLVGSSIGTIMAKMKTHGIREVSLRTKPQFTEKDLEAIFNRVYTDENPLVSKEKACGIVKQVDTLFSAVRKQVFEPEMLSPLVDMGASLTEEILRSPSLASSLGKVHDADEYTFVHSFNVAVLAGFLTHRVHPGDRDYIQKVVVGALLHDMGKARIPIEILNKPGPLSGEEFAVMKTHPTLGVELALKSGIKDPDILLVIRDHHEKWSGKGYPFGRKGPVTSEAARIAAIADVFDALTAKRVYKKPMSSRDAVTLIMKDAGGHFDTKIARELLVSLGLYPPGSIVSLSDGSVALVVSSGGEDLVRPVLMLKESRAVEKQPDAAPIFLDLKTTDNLYILRHLGHGEKRDLGLPLKSA